MALQVVVGWMLTRGGVVIDLMSKGLRIFYLQTYVLT